MLKFSPWLITSQFCSTGFLMFFFFEDLDDPAPIVKWIKYIELYTEFIPLIIYLDYFLKSQLYQNLNINYLSSFIPQARTQTLQSLRVSSCHKYWTLEVSFLSTLGPMKAASPFSIFLADCTNSPNSKRIPTRRALCPFLKVHLSMASKSIEFHEEGSDLSLFSLLLSHLNLSKDVQISD